MFHIPIVKASESNREIEFSHIVNDCADKNTWRDNPNISLDHVKINIFVRGEFSVVIENECYTPVYGDFCVLPVHRVHYGRVYRPTALEYYQLDIGVCALDCIPGGRALLDSLVGYASTRSPFVRPSAEIAKQILSLSSLLETAVGEGKSPLAFAYAVELLAKMESAYSVTERSLPNRLSKPVTKAISYIEDNYSQPIKVEEIADTCRVSSSYLSRVFKKELGVSVHSYINNLRISRAVQMLSSQSVADTATANGFCDSSHFIAVFKKSFGITPSEYLRKKQSI